VTAFEGIAEFSDPRLVAIYDSVNSYGPGTQPDFYAQLATELGARTIIDLGCGTGLITCELARRGNQMIGVEPSKLMLDIARHRPEGDQVRWIEGDVSRLGTPNAELAIMSGHVAQFFLTDETWSAALSALHAALVPGGRLAFESRNPDATAREVSTSAARRSVSDPLVGRIDTWTEVHDVQHEIVSCSNHYLFVSTGEELVSRARLRFRSEDELRQSLVNADFTVERLYGDWDRRPAGRTTRELIVVAAR